MHKSAGNDNFKNEINRSGGDTAFNRNHYLITELPSTFQDIESAGIRVDSTMGFPESIGFRNSYGFPIRPFNLKDSRPYTFVEVPLTIMDTTLKFYQKNNSRQAEIIILDFLNKNKENAVITILWHNNYFFDYADKGWLTCYKNILRYLIEQDFERFDVGQNIQ